jgi:uncharacterized membrane protein YbaN (DUF454 family)
VRTFYFVCGSACLALGFIGIFVPLLPTTPLVLLAAFFFSKSSTRMHQWLINHSRFGPLIRDWHEHRVIRPRAKWLASITIVVVMGVSLAFGTFPGVLKLVIAATGAGVILLICSYPSRPS